MCREALAEASRTPELHDTFMTSRFSNDTVPTTVNLWLNKYEQKQLFHDLRVHNVPQRAQISLSKSAVMSREPTAWTKGQ